MPDREFRVLQAFTRGLPRVKGAGVIANLVKRFYIRKPREPVETTLFGYRVRLDPVEHVDRELIFTPHLFDPEMIDYVRANLRPDDNFLDGGANVGMFSLAAAGVLDGGKVLAIEADPFNFQKLSLNVSMNGLESKVLALNVGLADSDAVLKFGIGPTGNRGTSNFLGATAGPETTQVQAHTLKTIMAKTGLRFRGIKLDLEGFEYRVLKKFFEEADPMDHFDFAVVEQHAHGIEDAGGDSIELLKSKGYRITWEDGIGNYILERVA